MSWYIIYPKYDDSNIYGESKQIQDHFCSFPKCKRLLSAYVVDWSIVKLVKKDFMLLSSMNLLIVSDAFLSRLSENATNDFSSQNIGEGRHILNITSTCKIASDLVDESSICPVCHNSLSRTYGRAFVKKGIELFRGPENKDAVLCRTKITMRDSSRASYDLFAKDYLAEKLNKEFRCFDLIKCVN